jgi:hypothetical protein
MSTSRSNVGHGGVPDRNDAGLDGDPSRRSISAIRTINSNDAVTEAAQRQYGAANSAPS